MDFAFENLMQKEKIDRKKEDDATKVIITQRKIEKMVIDEYNKESVEEQKIKGK